MNWKEVFEDYKASMPEVPDVSTNDLYLDGIRKQLDYLYEVCGSSLITSNEPKIIIKREGNAFQKSKFKENYTFLFQSLVDGRQSQLIPLADRGDLGLMEKDRENGGIYPDKIDMVDNVLNVKEHYWKLYRRAWDKKHEKLKEYHEKIADMRSEWWEDYRLYLASPEWRHKREARLEMDGHGCTMCINHSDLHVHHVTYENVGNERVRTELLTVCRDCHSRIHGRQL